jgi:hypothetical protein
LTHLNVKDCEEILLSPIKGFSYINVGSVQILKTRILLTDRLTGAIHIYHRSGKFIATIQPVLKTTGPITIGRSSESSNLIGVLSKSTNTLMFYNFDGEFVTQIKTPAKCLDFLTIDSANFIEFYPQPLNIHNKGYAFKKMSLNNRPILTTIENPILTLNSCISYYYLRIYADSLSYWEYRSNVLYHISNDGNFVKKYIFNLGSNPLDFNRVSSAATLNNESKKTISITRIIESSKHIYMESVEHGSVFFLLFDKLSKQIVKLKDSKSSYPSPAITDDLFLGEPFIPYDVTNSGNFFSFNKQVIIDKKSKMDSGHSLSSNGNFDNSTNIHAQIKIMKY